MENRDWLLTNGRGAYCIGSSDETNFRRDHALFTAMMRPPLRREKCIRRLYETIYMDGLWQPVLPTTDRHPKSGFKSRFHLVDGLPTYEYRAQALTLQKRYFMEPGKDAFYVQYRVIQAEGRCRLRMHPLLILPDGFFDKTFAEPPLQIGEHGFAFHFELEDGRQLHFQADIEVQVVIVNNWLATAFADDQDGEPETNFVPAALSLVLEKGQVATVRVGLEAVQKIDPKAVLKKIHDKSASGFVNKFEFTDEEMGPIRCHNSDFVIERATINALHNTTILSGYPDQTDNGRSMLLSLPGLLLSTGNFEHARKVLDMLKNNVSHNLLPYEFSGQPLPPNYSGADIALWYFISAFEYWQASQDRDFLEKNYSFLLNLLMELINGTENGVAMDKQDGLLEIAADATATSWMDAKVGRWMVTSRTGKPIELQALWYNALQILLHFSELLEKSASEAKLRAYLELAETHIQKAFWLPRAGYLADVLTPFGLDSSFRANQVIALGLPFSPFSEQQSLSVLEKVMMQLVTPYGLRTLSPFHAAYRGDIGSTPAERQGAWHNGVVHPWLTWPCVRAMLRNGYPPDEAYVIFRPLFLSVQTGMLGHVHEAFSGDKPHAPHGVSAHAASLGAVIQCLTALKGGSSPSTSAAIDLQISAYSDLEK